MNINEINNISFININENEQQFSESSISEFIIHIKTKKCGYIVLMTHNSLNTKPQFTHEFKNIIEKNGYSQFYKNKYEMEFKKNDPLKKKSMFSFLDNKLYIRIRFFKLSNIRDLDGSLEFNITYNKFDNSSFIKNGSYIIIKLKSKINVDGNVIDNNILVLNTYFQQNTIANTNFLSLFEILKKCEFHDNIKENYNKIIYLPEEYVKNLKSYILRNNSRLNGDLKLKFNNIKKVVSKISDSNYLLLFNNELHDNIHQKQDEQIVKIKSTKGQDFTFSIIYDTLKKDISNKALIKKKIKNKIEEHFTTRNAMLENNYSLLVPMSKFIKFFRYPPYIFPQLYPKLNFSKLYPNNKQKVIQLNNIRKTASTKLSINNMKKVLKEHYNLTFLKTSIEINSKTNNFKNNLNKRVSTLENLISYFDADFRTGLLRYTQQDIIHFKNEGISIPLVLWGSNEEMNSILESLKNIGITNNFNNNFKKIKKELLEPIGKKINVEKLENLENSNLNLLLNNTLENNKKTELDSYITYLKIIRSNKKNILEKSQKYNNMKKLKEELKKYNNNKPTLNTLSPNQIKNLYLLKLNKKNKITKIENLSRELGIPSNINLTNNDKYFQELKQKYELLEQKGGFVETFFIAGMISIILTIVYELIRLFWKLTKAYVDYLEHQCNPSGSSSLNIIEEFISTSFQDYLSTFLILIVEYYVCFMFVIIPAPIVRTVIKQTIALISYKIKSGKSFSTLGYEAYTTITYVLNIYGHYKDYKKAESLKFIKVKDYTLKNYATNLIGESKLCLFNKIKTTIKDTIKDTIPILKKNSVIMNNINSKKNINTTFDSNISKDYILFIDNGDLNNNIEVQEIKKKLLISSNNQKLDFINIFKKKDDNTFILVGIISISQLCVDQVYMKHYIESIEKEKSKTNKLLNDSKLKNDVNKQISESVSPENVKKMENFADFVKMYFSTLYKKVTLK